MNIPTICDKIDLQIDIRNRVLSFVDDFDFQSVDESQKGYFIYESQRSC